MASCLNGSAGKEANYQHFDVENMITPEQASGGPKAGIHGSSNASDTQSDRRSRNMPFILSLVTLAISLVALAFGIYASVKATRPRASAAGGLLLVSNPRDVPSGYRAANLYAGTGYFARLTPMMYPRSDHKTFPVGTTVYLLGGLTNGLEVQAAEGNATAAAAAEVGPPVPEVLNATVAYNTYTESITQRADMPEPRFRFCGAVLDGQLYVVGGMSAYEPPTAEAHVALGTAMRFNPAENRWQQLQATMKHPRTNCCASSINGKLYVAGGWTANYTDTLGSVEVYDPELGVWEFAPNLTVPRGDCEAVTMEDKYMYVLGGYDVNGNFTSSVEAFDPAANTVWEPRANMNFARGDFAAEALPNGRIIVMGGETSSVTGGTNEYAMHQVEEYMSASDTWVPKAPLPEARFRFDTAHVGDRVYVFGGQPTCVSGVASVGDKDSCVKVALDTTWGYFDVEYPELYAAVKQD